MRQPYETLSARARSGETALPRTLLEACGRQRNAKRISETATSRPVKNFPGQVLRGNPSRTLRYQTERREISLNLALLRHRSISALTWLHISPAQTRTRLRGFSFRTNTWSSMRRSDQISRGPGIGCQALEQDDAS